MQRRTLELDLQAGDAQHRQADRRLEHKARAYEGGCNAGRQAPGAQGVVACRWMQRMPVNAPPAAANACAAAAPCTRLWDPQVHERHPRPACTTALPYTIPASHTLTTALLAPPPFRTPSPHPTH
eukprot:352223-Chlamydomonas_euryale.AAC.3